jgi:hypothetical protein
LIGNDRDQQHNNNSCQVNVRNHHQIKFSEELQFFQTLGGFT